MKGTTNDATRGTVARPPLVLLPAIDVTAGRAVQAVRNATGTEPEYGDPLGAARTWVEGGAEWIHLVDLDAALGRGENHAVIRHVIREVGRDVNVQLSGGVHDDASLAVALDVGATRINVGSAALANPAWAANAIGRHGDLVAIGLEVRCTLEASGRTPGRDDLWGLLERLNEAGCARYVVTDVMRDGMLQGPNLDLLREIALRSERPVIAAGGISDLGDIGALRDLVPTGLEGAIIGRALYDGAFTLQQALTVAHG